MISLKYLGTPKYDEKSVLAKYGSTRIINDNKIPKIVT